MFVFRRLSCAALLGVLLAGCTTPPPPEGPTPPPASIDLLLKPRDIREDYAYPMPAMWQRFRWADFGVDWQMRFPPHVYAYAGIIFRKPHDFSMVYATTRITFRVEPAHLARGLSVGLVDGDAQPGRVLIDLPLSPPLPAGPGVFTVALPLTAFPTEGPVVDAAGEDQAGQLQRFDWTDVRELRLISPGHDPRALREVSVTRLRFVR